MKKVSSSAYHHRFSPFVLSISLLYNSFREIKALQEIEENQYVSIANDFCFDIDVCLIDQLIDRYIDIDHFDIIFVLLCRREK